MTNETSASGSAASAAFGSSAAAGGGVPTSLSMRWALNGGILALRSLVVIDRLPAMRMNGRTRITSRLPTRVTVETRTTFRAAVDFAGRRQAIALVQAGGLVVGAERAAQRALDPFRHLGKGHFAVERRKNGAADQSCAA